MSDIKERLRDAVQKLRRTPMAIADVAPMLQAASDHIATIEQESAANLQRALVAEKGLSNAKLLLAEADEQIPWFHDGADGDSYSNDEAIVISNKIKAFIAPDTSTQEVG